MPDKSITIIKESPSLKQFKAGVDDLLSKRDYFIAQVFPKLVLNQDYFIIKDKKSLAKGGAEKLASIYLFRAEFFKDDEMLAMIGETKGLIALKCLLYKNGEVVGEGRGADTVARNQGDPNKAIKMAQKRAYVDAVIRTTGLSDIFTQDLEDESTEEKIKKGKASKEEMMVKAVALITNATSTSFLVDSVEKIKESKKYAKDQKEELITLISARIDALQNIKGK